MTVATLIRTAYGYEPWETAFMQLEAVGAATPLAGRCGWLCIGGTRPYGRFIEALCRGGLRGVDADARDVLSATAIKACRRFVVAVMALSESNKAIRYQLPATSYQLSAN